MDESVIIHVKPTEEYFPLVLLIMLYKVVLTFESVGEILKCGHSNESYWAALSCGTAHYAVKRGPLTFSKRLHLWMRYEECPFKKKLLRTTSLQ